MIPAVSVLIRIILGDNKAVDISSQAANPLASIYPHINRMRVISIPSSASLHVLLSVPPSLIPPSPHLNPPNNHSPLPLQHIPIPLFALPLTILQPTTLVILQHAMFAAKMSLAERTIAYDSLRALRTCLERAFRFLVVASRGGGGCG